jgi:hypothetical protein
MEEGTTIDYRLRLLGVPLRWQARVLDWVPPDGFEDEQVRGPYRFWRHPSVLRRKAIDDHRRRGALPTAVQAVWRSAPSTGATTIGKDLPVSALSSTKLPPRSSQQVNHGTARPHTRRRTSWRNESHGTLVLEPGWVSQ